MPSILWLCSRTSIIALMVSIMYALLISPGKSYFSQTISFPQIIYCIILLQTFLNLINYIFWTSLIKIVRWANYNFFLQSHRASFFTFLIGIRQSICKLVEKLSFYNILVAQNTTLINYWVCKPAHQRWRAGCINLRCLTIFLLHLYNNKK